MPRNANGSGSIRKKTITKPNGKSYTFYEARVTVGYDPVTGKQKQKSITGKTQSEVRKKMSEMIFEVDRGEYKDLDKMTVAEWADIWLELYVEGKVKPYTVDSYRSICKNHIIPNLGQIELRKLNTDMIQSFYKFLESKLSPKTIKNVHGVLHKMLGKAVRSKKIGFNPSDDCELPAVEKKELTVLEQDDVKHLMSYWHGDRFERIYLITLFTGMRQGEVLGLTRDCIDFEVSGFRVNKQLTKTKQVGGKYCLAPTKNSRSRFIFAAPTVMELLEEQIEAQDRMKERAGDTWNNEWNLVFTNETGGHLTHRTVYKGFKASVRALGLDAIRFHDLRHTFAVASLEAGDDIKTVQENLGHASAAFTMNVYAHASQRMKQRSASNMESYIRETARVT